MELSSTALYYIHANCFLKKYDPTGTSRQDVQSDLQIISKETKIACLIYHTHALFIFWIGRLLERVQSARVHA